MTASDRLRLLARVLLFLVAISLHLLYQRASTFVHKRRYVRLPPSQTKNVVVIGGSFAGVQLAKRLSGSLPIGFRIILIEKNSHLNFLFAFPRFSVVSGYESLGFIPYAGIANGAPKGIFEHLQNEVAGMTDEYVLLKSGEKIKYEYLAIATGTSSPLPSKVTTTNHIKGQEELRSMQSRIFNARRIAIVGGGAVGVELASDIKDVYTDKDVVLIHSRDRLLPTFGRKLHDHVIKALEEIGIQVLLNERPNCSIHGHCSLELLNGKIEEFDLVVPCTGQRPNSEILAAFSPNSISETSRILVRPTLQIIDEYHSNIFSFGDVAETGGPRMARASLFQTEVVCYNILSLIRSDKRLKSYKPKMWIEGSIKLTLGLKHIVLYTQDDDGEEILIAMSKGTTDMGVKRSWRFYGADPDA